MSALWRFILNMDARLVRAVLISVALFSIVLAILLLGKVYLGPESQAWLGQWLVGASSSPVIIPAVVLAFVVLAFVGVPQFVLIAAAVLAVGPLWGGVLSWLATMISAMVGYGLGVRFGARLMPHIPSRRLQRLIAAVSRNGFSMSLVVRLVPSAPFIVVNMAAGTAKISALAFALGTGLGIVPKITLVALAGTSVGQVLSGRGQWAIMALGAAIVVWLLIMAWARKRVRQDVNEEA